MARKYRYHVIEATDLMTKKRTYKIYVKNTNLPPVLTGIATREEAEIRLREIEAAEQ